MLCRVYGGLSLHCDFYRVFRMAPKTDQLESKLVSMLALPAEKRRDFLAQVEQSDPELGERLSEMVSHFSPFDEKEPHAPPPENMSWLKTISGEDTGTLQLNRDVTLTLEDPETVGRFKVIKRIGEGGMGRVYLAEEPDSGRKVALKIINRDQVQLTITERFRQEYQALAMMNHASIARLYEVGTSQNQELFFTMEYVPGSPINSYCRAHKMSPRQCVLLFLQVCHGLRHAHQKALLHRDLKPGNILVKEEGDRAIAKIIDFGLAKPLAPVLKDEREQHTKVGTIVGTPSFLAPELLNFDQNRPDVRGDIYALGIVFYEMLTGVHPFGHHNVPNLKFDDLREIIREGVKVPPSKRLKTLEANDEARNEHAQKIPRELDWIVLKAMDPDMGRRYGGLAELISDLEAYLDNRPVSAGPPGVGYRIGKYIKRNKLLVSAGTFTFLTTILAIVLVVRSAFLAQEARKETDLALKKAETAITILSEMLEAPDPRNRGKDARVVDLLSSAEEQLTGTGEEEAILRPILGTTYFGLGAYDEALEHLERAEELLDKENDLEKWAQASFQLNLTRNRLQQTQAALKGFEKITRRLEPYQDAMAQAYYRGFLGMAISRFKNREDDRALDLYKHAYEGFHKHLGDKHADTIKALGGKAACFDRLKDFERAEETYREVIVLQRKELGSQHVESLATKHNYALFLKKSGELEKAATYMESAFNGRKEVLGDKHQLTLISQYEWARIYAKAERFNKAVELLETVANLHWEKSGPVDRYTLRARYTLALYIGHAGRHEDAVSGFQAIIRECMKWKLTDSPYVGRSYNSMGHFYMEMDMAREARNALERSLDIRLAEGVTGPIIRTLGNLGEAMAQLGHQEAALQMAEDAWLRKPISSATKFYGERLVEARRFEEAEALLLPNYQKNCMQDSGYKETAEVLAKLYKEKNDPVNARKWETIARNNL